MRRFPLHRSGYSDGMARFEDDDDWVGEPPEGHHTRDQANPDFWRTQRPVQLIGAAVVIGLIVLVVVLLAR
jgi:hypothetical protein